MGPLKGPIPVAPLQDCGHEAPRLQPQACANGSGFKGSSRFTLAGDNRGLGPGLAVDAGLLVQQSYRSTSTLARA